MSKKPIYEKIKEATDFIKSHYGKKPEIGIILGSGLGSIADQVQNPVVLSYTSIPHFHGTSIEGHSGKMILGDFQGVPTVILQGRFHLYEGYPMDDVVLPTRTVASLGAHTLVLTNAAGGVNTKFRPGDVMVINDHLNLMCDNPLKGPNLSEWGPRFPDLSEAYHSSCVNALEEAASSLNIQLRKGVYAGLLGPTYETPAEVRMLRTLGADAVGMSTVPECIAANHLGVRVAGLSCITNLAAGITNAKLTHDEVIHFSREGAKKMTQILTKALPKLAVKLHA